jgi:hypothetical protein
MRTFLATPQLFFRIENYLLCKGRDDSALRRALLTRYQLTVLLLHGRFQPAFDIEDHPLLWRVFLHRPHQ